MKKIILSVLTSIAGLFPLSALASYSGYIVNDAAISVDTKYVLNLKANNILYGYATATYASAAPAAKTFTDGQVSNGSITVATLASLTTAYATNSITIVSTAGLTGAIIAIPNFTFKEGVDWKMGATTALSAASITTALAKIDWLTAVRTGSVIALTSKVAGTYYNSKPASSNNSGITFASPLFTGGQDNAVVTVNGVPFKANVNWTLGTTPTLASTGLAAAINGNVGLAALLTATANSPTAGITALVSDAVGASKNFSLASSIPAALVLSGATMTGGSGSNFATGSALITIPAHGFNTGLAVAFTEDTVAVSPLVSGTVYYVIKVDANTIKLALTHAAAVLGTGITITATPGTLHVHTLTPEAIAGNSSFKWEKSDDGITYKDMSVASVTISNYATLPLSTSWDLDTSSTYIRLNLIAPATAGALNLSVLVNGLEYSQWVRTAGDVVTGRVHFLNAPITMSGVSGTITSASTITALNFAGSFTGNATTATTATNVPAVGVAAGALNKVTSLTASSATVTGAIGAGGSITAGTGGFIGDGSHLTGISTGSLSGLNAGYLSKAISANAIADSIVFETTGKIGIGTTAPVFALDIANSNPLSLAFHRTGVSAKKWGFDSDNGFSDYLNVTDSTITWCASNATGGMIIGHDYCTIQPNMPSRGLLVQGNVGIGTVQPVSKLTVSSGTLTIDGDVQLAINLSQGDTVRTMKNGVGTKAQLQALAPGSLYETVICSNCSTWRSMISTGTNAGNWARDSAVTTALGAW